MLLNKIGVSMRRVCHVTVTSDVCTIAQCFLPIRNVPFLHEGMTSNVYAKSSRVGRIQVS